MRHFFRRLLPLIVLTSEATIPPGDVLLFVGICVAANKHPGSAWHINKPARDRTRNAAGGAVHAEGEDHPERAKDHPARKRCPHVLVLAGDVTMQAGILADRRGRAVRLSLLLFHGAA